MNPLGSCISTKLGQTGNVNVPGFPAVINMASEAMSATVPPLKAALAGFDAAKKLAESITDPAKTPQLITDLQKKVDDLKKLVPPNPQAIIETPLLSVKPPDLNLGVAISSLTSISINASGVYDGQTIPLSQLGGFLSGLILCPIKVVLAPPDGIVPKLLGIFEGLISLNTSKVSELSKIPQIPAQLSSMVESALRSSWAAAGVDIDTSVVAEVTSACIECTTSMLKQPFTEIGL